MVFLNSINIILIILIIFFSKINSNIKIQMLAVFSSIDKHYLFRDILSNFFNKNINAYKISSSDRRINITKNLHLEDETKRVWYSTTSKYEEILIELFYLPSNFSRFFDGSTFNSIKIISYDYDKYNCWFDFSYMFKDCKNLISVDLSNFILPDPNNLEYMFTSCSNLKYLLFPKTSLNYPTNLYKMFSYCSSLTSIDLTNLTLKNAYIKDIFYGCNNLESVEMKGNFENKESFSDLNNNRRILGNMSDIFPLIFEPTVLYDIRPGDLCFYQASFDEYTYIDTFEEISVKQLNLFDMKLKFSLNYLDSLEECLFYEYLPNFKRCSKFIGFHYCGNCNNNNSKTYCTKTIEGNNYNFYYLEDQLNISKYYRTCFWSNNNGSFKNYIFDKDKWIKCNERCETCINQSMSEIDHKCLSCNMDNNYYPYKEDFDDLINNKINSINCFNIEEVKSNYSNYFFKENAFEKCDISCEECISKNKCSKCSDNYYNIYENENGSCLHYPLDNYELININNKKYFQKCKIYCTKYNNTITINLFKENINETIIKYFREYENNTIGIIRANEFSNYFYNQSTNYSILKELGIPIFNFTECIDKIKKKFNIDKSIFIQIIEYNAQIDKKGKKNKNPNLVNSTEYQLFLENGTILDYSICNGLNVIVEKKVIPIKINKKEKEEIKELEDKNNISIFDNKKIIDYCFPLILYDKDYSFEQRILLSMKIKPPCDDDCIFHSFNLTTYYSTCICPIKLDKDNDDKKINSLFDENDNIAKFKELYKNGNIKYFKCFMSIINKNNNQKHNWLRYFSFFNLFMQIIIMHTFYIKDKNNIISIYDNKIKKIQNSEMKTEKIIIITSKEYMNPNGNNNFITSKENVDINSKTNLNIKSITNDNNKNTKKKHKRSLSNKPKKANEDKKTEESSNYSEMDFPKSWKNDKRNFCKIFLDIFCDIIFIFKNSDKQFFPISLIIIMLNISFHTFLFFNAFFFSDNYITDINLYKIKNKIEYIFVKETKRLIIVSFFCICIIKLLFWLFSGQEKLEETEQLLNYGLQKDKYIRRIERLRTIIKIKNIIGQILVCFLHLLYTYFILIFGNINSHIQIHLFITMLCSIAFYLIFYSIISFIISIIRYCSLKYESEFWFDCSKCIQNLVLN